MKHKRKNRDDDDDDDEEKELVSSQKTIKNMNEIKVTTEMRGCELNSSDRKLKQNDIIMSGNRTISSVNWNGNSVCMQFDGEVEQKWLELV